jgi:hypothetical protein
MKRFLMPRALVVVLLPGLLIVLSPAQLAFAANHTGLLRTRSSDYDPGTNTKVFTCLGNVALQVVATLLDGEEFTFGKLASSASTCVDAAATIFNNLSSTPSSSQVDINVSPYKGVFNGVFQFNPVSNCTNYPRELQFNFGVPFGMIVGPPEDQGSFQSPPSGSGDNELVAQQLFGRYSNNIASTTTSSSPGSVYTVAPHTQVTFMLPVSQYYVSGEARVVHTDGSVVIRPWLYTAGYQPTGSINYITSSC